MDDDQLLAALRALKPTAQLPDVALFKADIVEAAGIDLSQLTRWATEHGGGPIDAGQLKLRKGQRPEQSRPGRPQPFIAVPLRLLG